MVQCRPLLVLAILLTAVCGLGVARAEAQPTGPLMVPPPGKAATERIITIWHSPVRSSESVP